MSISGLMYTTSRHFAICSLLGVVVLTSPPPPLVTVIPHPASTTRAKEIVYRIVLLWNMTPEITESPERSQLHFLHQRRLRCTSLFKYAADGNNTMARFDSSWSPRPRRSSILGRQYHRACNKQLRQLFQTLHMIKCYAEYRSVSLQFHFLDGGPTECQQVAERLNYRVFKSLSVNRYQFDHARSHAAVHGYSHVFD